MVRVCGLYTPYCIVICHFHYISQSLFRVFFSMMIRCVFVLLLAAAAVALVQASQYVTYEAGTLPLVITAPHGGSLNPSSFPERSIDTSEYN